MPKMKSRLLVLIVAIAVALIGVAVIVVISSRPDEPEESAQPSTKPAKTVAVPSSPSIGAGKTVQPSTKPAKTVAVPSSPRIGAGKTVIGDGKPSADTDTWTQFRGDNRDGIVSAASAEGLYRTWPAEGPKVLWSVNGLGNGYSGAAIQGGKVYFQDYDEKTKYWKVRCVSLADGKSIWQYSYRRLIRPNHGVTRSLPAVDENYVVGIDPKAVVHGIDAKTGKRLWVKDLVGEYGCRIPSWYNGQCPVNDGDRVVVGMAGKKGFMAAFNKATGKPDWVTEAIKGTKMSHSSVMPATIAGRKQYVWCTLDGIRGVDAADGKLLWHYPWDAHAAVAPSVLVIGDGRIFMTSGYKAGSVMIRVEEKGGKFVPSELFKLTYKQFVSECQTAVLFEDHMISVDHAASQKGLMSCVGLDGKIVWQHKDANFGLGNWILANGLIYVMDGHTGRLHMLKASTTGYEELASAAVGSTHESWAPIAYANGKLVVRDLGKMVCIEVGATK